MAINSVSLVGNITFEPELKSTAGGTQVLSFNIAVNERKKNNQTGEWEDAPVFVGCTMFGKRAESVSNFISKGSKVAIEGKLNYHEWEKDGQKRNRLDVIVNNIEFLSKGSSQQKPVQDLYTEDVPF